MPTAPTIAVHVTAGHDATAIGQQLRLVLVAVEGRRCGSPERHSLMTERLVSVLAVKWAAPVREEIAAHLVRLGLTKCPICDAETLSIDGRPVALPVGGAPWTNPEREKPKDPDADVYFMVRIECEVCGYNMLFNVERFHDGDTPVFAL